MAFWDKAIDRGKQALSWLGGLFGKDKPEPKAAPSKASNNAGQQVVVTTNTGMQPTAPVPNPAQVFQKSESSFNNSKVPEPCRECEEAVEHEKKKGGDWRLAHSLVTLRAQINKKFPNRNKVSDGAKGDSDHQSRDSDHNPWVRDGDKGVVTAIDITHDPQNGCDAEMIAQALVNSRDPRIKYIIWNRRIAVAPGWNWEPYTGKNAHNKHIHISVSSDKSLYDSASPWAL